MNDIVRSFLLQRWIFMLNFNQLKIKVEHRLALLYEQLIDYDENDVKLIQYLIFFFALLYNSFVHLTSIPYSNETVLFFNIYILFLFFFNS